MFSNYCILFSLFLLLHTSFQVKLKVNIKHGCVEGQLSKKYADVAEFLGVPFATPPVGKNRFKAPKPVSKTFYGKECYQALTPAKTCLFERKHIEFEGHDEWQPNFLDMSEDCLQLNIWVPTNTTGAVIVFIYGTGYRYASPSLPQHDGSALASLTGSIIINIGYRSGVLGFAYYKHGHIIPGNMGLLDQQLALEWIYENIEQFGGKKSMVTLFGHSSGSSLATAHLFSHGSSKYFSKVIASSGTILNNWALQKSQVISKNFRSLMDIFNCSHAKEEVEIKCMQKIDVYKLVQKAAKIRNPEQLRIIDPFSPMDSDNFFFKDSVRELLERGNIKKKFDILIGRTTDEATVFMPQFLKSPKYGCMFYPFYSTDHKKNQCQMKKIHYENSIKVLVRALHLRNSAIKHIRDLYRKNKKLSLRDKAARMFADFFMDCDVVDFAKKISNYARNKYFYVLGKTVSINPWPKWMGVTHDYTTYLTFGHPFLERELYSPRKLHDDQKFSYQVMATLAKFAKTSKLYKSWPQFKRSKMVAAFVKHVLFPRDKFEKINVDTKKCRRVQFIKHHYHHNCKSN